MTINHPCVLYVDAGLDRAVVMLRLLPGAMLGRKRTMAFFRFEDEVIDPTRFLTTALSPLISETDLTAPRREYKRGNIKRFRTPVAGVHLSDLKHALKLPLESPSVSTSTPATRGFDAPDPIEIYAEYQRETLLLNIATRANCVPDASVAAWSQAVRDKLAVVSPKKAFKSPLRHAPIVLTYNDEDD